MLGYDISWAAFNIIEVMSASKFTFKVSWLWGLNPVVMGTWEKQVSCWGLEVPWAFLWSILWPEATLSNNKIATCSRETSYSNITSPVFVKLFFFSLFLDFRERERKKKH